MTGMGIDAAECNEMARQVMEEAMAAQDMSRVALTAGKRDRYTRAAAALTDAAEAFLRAAEELRQVGLEP